MPVLEADPLNERTHALIATMVSRVSLAGKKVGVGEVLSHGGRSTPLGTYLAEQIDVALSRLRMASGFQIVERRWLKQVLEEYQLCQSGITEAACAKQLGTLVDADILLLGSLIDLGDRISLTVKLIETKTGFNLGAESIRISKDPAMTQLLIEPSIYPPSHTGLSSQEISPHVPEEEPGRLQVKLWTERTVYRLGEDVRLHFVTNRNAYVTLVNVGTSGTVSILFPNRFFRSAFVRGGQQMTVPQDGAGFAFVLQGPPGTEIVRLVASEEPIEFTLTDLAATEAPVRSLGQLETATLTRDIATAKAQRSKEHWAEAVASFEVR
jgi:TolB-like protein